MPTELNKTLDMHFFGAMVTSSISLGKQLGLFDALAEVATEANAADAKTVADKAGCKERYVREWLSCMACGEIIEITPDEKFWMTDEAKHEFAGLNSPAVAKMAFLAPLVKNFDELAQAFKKDSGKYGLEYAQFSAFYETMDKMSQAMHSKHLISDYFPLIGMADKLERGGLQVLDVGCGSGFHAMTMAKQYPNCQVIGTDISENAISMAKESQKKMWLANLEFQVMDAGDMNPEWTAKFDFITIFDACHDQMRPDLCMKEVYRMLKPNGTLAMLEVDGTSNAYTDKQVDGRRACVMYAMSMFHCLPVGSNSPDALCMGNMWGEKRALELLEKTGFAKEHIKVIRPSFFPINIVYVCTKQ